MQQQSVFSNSKGMVSIEMMKGEVADAVLEAVKEINDGVQVSDLPGYIIIEVPSRIVVEAELVRDHLGKDWTISDLNEVMHAFAGQIEIYTEDQMVLSWRKK